MKYFFVLLFFCSFLSNAQYNRNKVLVSGGGRVFKINYNNNPINITQINTLPFVKYFVNGHSNICDSSGKLLLLSDGYHIYDTTLSIIDGGDTLVPNGIYIDHNGFSPASQSSIFLPMDSNQYYFITPTATDSMNTAWYLPNATETPFDLLWYSKIDMNAYSGSGKVVKRKQPLLEHVKLSKTGMMACRHANGKDWWLLKPALDTNMIYTFRVTQDSIYQEPVQGFAEPHFGFFDTDGQTMFNQQGTMYASNTRHCTAVFIANFDRCYGTLSNPKIIHTPPITIHNPFDTTEMEFNYNVGLAFSPNSQFLYISSRFNIWQYELNNTDSASAWVHIAGLDTTWQAFMNYSNMYLGADSKLYIGNFAGLSAQMSVINNPDVKGAGCTFCPRCLRFPDFDATTPPCMPNYSLGAKDTCFPVGVTYNIKEPLSELLVYPNPTYNILYIKNQYNKKKELYNSIGQLILTTTKDEVNVTMLPKGLYYVKVGSITKKVIIE